MTDSQITTIVTGIPAILAALGALWASVHNAAKIEDLKKSTDGKLDQLVEARIGEAGARGELKARDEAKVDAPSKT